MPEVEEIVDATHAGDCPRCNGAFVEGDEVYWVAEGAYFVHVGCAGL